MHNTRVKICGITSAQDALLCSTRGADYLGLIFAPSPRRVTIETAREIRAAVPGTSLIGVFQDAPLDEVVETTRVCQLNMVQLHGAETPMYCDALAERLSLPIIKTFTSPDPCDTQRMRDYTRTSYFLFDLAKQPSGDNGALRDSLWSCAAAIRRKGYRIFLAGALNESNVRDALQQVGPFGIDVASGVEASPGVKDSDAVDRFMKAVRG